MYRKTACILVLLILIAGTCFAGELMSKEADNYFNEGVKSQTSANFVEADINYQKALLVAPYSLELQKYILNNRGIMLAELGDLDQAESSFKAALSIDPSYKPAQLNLGYIYEKRRSRLESLEYWLQVLNINLDQLKPKSFVIQGEPKSASKK